MHRRLTPTEHHFTYPTSHFWIDPDRPQEISRQHPLWSCTWPAPVQIRRRDYLDGGTGKMRNVLQQLVEDSTGYRPTGPIRMLSQPRMWGWLFNPITLYFLWDNPQGSPVAAVAEVSNTPWKERHHYPVLLAPQESDHGTAFEAQFNKKLHVSPFLGSEYVYQLRLTNPSATKLKIQIDVLSLEGDAVLKTSLAVEKQTATRSNLTSVLKNNPLATHRVSKGIHTQAARLLAKKVPFVSHPDRKPDQTTSAP